MVNVGVTLAALVGVLALASSAGLAQSARKGRVVVMGDIHADITVLRRAFRLAGATDEQGAWVGGPLTVVQLGDLIGRSDDEREVLDFIFDVQRKARSAGGTVHALVGNHEVFGGRLDNQAVGPNPFPAYESVPGLRLDDPRLRHLPPAARARGAALMPGGPYATKIAAFPTVLRLGRTVYAHGGVAPRWARYGIEKINLEVRRWLLGLTPEPDSALGVDNGDRVMWTRQFSANVQPEDCGELGESLRILGATRMVVAHTVHREITSYCDGRVWAIDVGMSRAYGGQLQLLEILDDRAITVLRP